MNMTARILPETPPPLQWHQVSLNLGDFSVQDVSLQLDTGAWMCLVGPTGAGKTLLLEMAAGFMRPDVGRISRFGKDVTTLPPEKRRLAYVPQDNLLFPHLNVRENLLYGRRASPSEVETQMGAIAADLGIGHLLSRAIHTISGGEAQRVALGRALLLDSDVLLLDESTSALDEETREIVGAFLLRQRLDRSLSVVHITHDRSEAERLASKIVTIEAGQITAIDENSKQPSPQNISLVSPQSLEPDSSQTLATPSSQPLAPLETAR